MKRNSDIRYIRHGDLDKIAWDRCITNSPDSRIYALSWYLDSCSDTWDALIFEDYQAVMPLPYRLKWGLLPYVYLSFLSQQLGVFSITELFPPLDEWLKQIPKKFLSVDYLLHSGNACDDRFNRYPNYLVNLKRPFIDIRKDYNQNRQRDLRKGEKAGLKFEKLYDIQLFIQSLKSSSEHYDYEKNWENKLTALHHIGNSLDAIHMAEVKNADQSSLYMLLYGTFAGRIYYLIPFSTNDKSRETGAATFLIDQLIKRYTSTYSYLDFEGSRIPGIADFFKSFGAIEEYYYHYQRRRI